VVSVLKPHLLYLHRRWVSLFGKFWALSAALLIWHVALFVKMKGRSLVPPPTPVCLKGPANIEKCAHKYFSHFYCILFLTNILAILAYVKIK
jgi:hypothetical protein